MFFSEKRRQKRVEESARRALCSRVYALVPAIQNDHFNYGIENHLSAEEISGLNPWTDDIVLVKEMVKKVERMDSADFIREYGSELKELEDRYLL